MTAYVELQILTHFSLLRGASSPEELFAAAALLGYSRSSKSAVKPVALRHLPDGREIVVISALFQMRSDVWRAREATAFAFTAGSRRRHASHLAGLTGLPHRRWMEIIMEAYLKRATLVLSGCREPIGASDKSLASRAARTCRGLVLGMAALHACPVSAAGKAEYHITATEVDVKAKSTARDWFRDRLQYASRMEASYYFPASEPVVMRIVVDRIRVKSAAKALASSLPILAMFSGANENRLRGKVTLIDGVTGRTLKRFNVECDDYTQYSAADGLFAYAQLGASFLPFGDLIASAADVGRSATSNRTSAQEKLVAGFTMLSYKKIYGAKSYKRFADRRRADLKSGNPPTDATAPSPTAGATVAALTANRQTMP